MTIGEAAKVRAYEKQNYTLGLPPVYTSRDYYNAYETLIEAGMENLISFPYLDELQEAQRVIDFALAKGEEI